MVVKRVVASMFEFGWREMKKEVGAKTVGK